jgi:serine/threonine-protein kinase
MKVVDFGVAKENESDLGLTRTGQAIGSPLYMSPEQMNGSRDVDARADIWSLGVTLYEMLAGTTPFFSDTLTELCARVHLGWPTPITEYRSDVPAGLAAVLTQCFEKRRERRWPNVAAFAAALAPYASERMRPYAERIASVARVDVPESRPTVELPRPTEAALATATIPTPATLASPIARAPQKPPRGWVWPVVGVVVALGLPAALYVGLRSRTPKAEPTVPMVVPVSTTTGTPPTSIALEPPDPPALPAMPSATTPAPPNAPAPARPTPSPLPHKSPVAKPQDGMPGGGRR